MRCFYESQFNKDLRDLPHSFVQLDLAVLQKVIAIVAMPGGISHNRVEELYEEIPN